MPADDARFDALDALFEALAPRIGKGEKGQFFTPRHVVEFVIRALAPKARDLVLDPACGSGAFLAHAHAAGARTTLGCEVDLRAVRVARLLAIAQGRDPQTITRGDGLREELSSPVTVVATNPPFAGRAPSTGFEAAALVRSPERDVLFLERSLRVLAPGGRLGIVLPYNKAAGQGFARLRGWLLAQARVLAVVGLPGPTFMPYTSQRTVVLLAKRRGRRERPRDDERTFLAVSERSGKTPAGEWLLRRDGALDHDLDAVSAALEPFLAEEGFAA